MKNLHVLPTDKKPIKGDLLLRHLWKNEPNECISWWRYNDTTMYGDTLVYTTLNGSFMDVPSSFKVQNIYITSNEDIKEGAWRYDIELNRIEKGKETGTFKNWKKIILTTDQDLIKDGVQPIDDEFLEWFVKNPSCEEVKIEGHVYKGQNLTHYKIIISKEEPKQDTVGKVFYESADKTITVYRQETLEEAAEKYAEGKSSNFTFRTTHIRDFSAGAKWQQEQDKNKYSEGDMINYALYIHETKNNLLSPSEWYEKFKKK